MSYFTPFLCHLFSKYIYIYLLVLCVTHFQSHFRIIPFGLSTSSILACISEDGGMFYITTARLSTRVKPARMRHICLHHRGVPLLGTVTTRVLCSFSSCSPVQFGLCLGVNTWLSHLFHVL